MNTPKKPAKSSVNKGWRIWGSIQCPEPPPMHHYHDQLLEQAQIMLATRERNFPEMVLRGDIASGAAQAELATFRLLIADLQWIEAAKLGEAKGPIPITPADRIAICAILDESIDVLSALFAEAGVPVPVKLSDQAHNVIALRWIYDPARGPLACPTEQHGLAMITGQLRAENQPQTQRSIAS
jgi:hypothetical protein